MIRGQGNQDQIECPAEHGTVYCLTITSFQAKQNIETFEVHTKSGTDYLFENVNDTRFETISGNLGSGKSWANPQRHCTLNGPTCGLRHQHHIGNEI